MSIAIISTKIGDSIEISTDSGEKIHITLGSKNKTTRATLIFKIPEHILVYRVKGNSAFQKGNTDEKASKESSSSCKESSKESC